jgi:hypothetical protein
LTEDLSDVAVISERRMTGVAGVSSKYGILSILEMLFRRVEVELLRSDKEQAELSVQEATFSKDRGTSR